jgi:SAM-dependent methyltransferase
MERAEFDQHADHYHDQHRRNICVTGEEPAYFSEYKIADLAKFVQDQSVPSASIFDFGSWIENYLLYFRKYFTKSELHCTDVSTRSMEIAQARFPGAETYVQIERDQIPVTDRSQDIIFTACVFHHIPTRSTLFGLEAPADYKGRRRPYDL